jgi:hypothetical protein
VEVGNERGVDRVELIDVDDALKAGLIEMRHFGGMTAEESSGPLELFFQVLRRDARLAQAWLRRKLGK